MANLLHSAKPGSDRTQGNLDAYNIHVHVEDTATFPDSSPVSCEKVLDDISLNHGAGEWTSCSTVC